MTSDTTSNLSRLSELLAAHGVYTLTVIFIFYQQARAARSLKTAKQQDHAYFKKVHASVVALTYVLVVVSTVVWIYATFFYSPKLYVRGSISGLTDQAVSPQKEGDPDRISERIAPEQFDTKLYEIKQIKNDQSNDGKYDLGWVLLPDNNVHTLVFRFQHSYERIKRPGKTLITHLASTSNTERNSTEKSFRIDLRTIHYSPSSVVELVYEPDPNDQTEGIGKIYLREPETSNLSPIAWEEIMPTQQKAITGLALPLLPRTPFAVYAASPTNSPFKENGDYDPQFGRLLRQRLADPDLRTQLAARSVLVENGNRTFKFILDTLKMPQDGSESEGLLISNLGSAVLEMESAGVRVTRDIDLQLAVVFEHLGDNKSSVQFFDKAAEKPGDPPELDFQRGVVYYLADNYNASIRNMDAFLNAKPNTNSQSTAQVVLANSYEKLGNDAQAIEHYKKAVALDHSQPLAYNGLAYLYAKRGENLPEALRLVDRALVLVKDADDVANYKDTKAWILYRMGRQDEALRLIREAAARLPDNPEIRDHLKIIQATGQVR